MCDMKYFSWLSTADFKDTSAASYSSNHTCFLFVLSHFTLSFLTVSFCCSCCSTYPSQQLLPYWGFGWPDGCPGWTEPRQQPAPIHTPAPGIAGRTPCQCQAPGWSSHRGAGQGTAPHCGNVARLSDDLSHSNTCGSLLCLHQHKEKRWYLSS